jgi:hypothetical protein
MPPRAKARGADAISAALADVALTPPGADGLRCVGKNSLAEGVVGDRTRTGGRREVLLPSFGPTEPW